MKIGVSACLLGDNCKYNGGNNLSSALVEKLKDVEVVKICPEVMGGLSIPRDPAEIVKGKVITNKNVSVDDEFRRGAALAVDLLKKEGVDYVISQPRSPSCGKGEIYDGLFRGRLINGDGIFVSLAKKEGIKVISPVEFIENY